MLAQAPVQPCIVIHAKPCSAVIRVLRKDGRYRYLHVIMRGSSGTFVSSLG